MEPEAQAAPAAAVQLVITLQGNQINPSGPLDNKLLCYGLLELAKESIQKLALEQERRLVQPVTGMLPRNGRI